MKKPQPQLKPQYTAIVASSIDGRISLAKKRAPDWTSREDWAFLQKSLSESDAVVVGRNTYQAAASRLRKRNTFVLSHRLHSVSRRGTVAFVNPENCELPKLLAGYRRVAILGGAAVYRFMLENCLCDEIFVTIEPLVMGRGTTMFAGGTRTVRTRLLSVKRLNREGTLLLRYRVDQL